MDILKTIQLRLTSLTTLPIAAFLSVSVKELSAERCRIYIPLTFRSRSPMKSMYMAAIVAGADIAGGLTAYDVARRKRADVSILFREMHVKFLKKVNSGATFVCEDVAAIAVAIEQTIASSEAVEIPLTVKAFTEKKGVILMVADFEMRLSVRKKERKR